MHVTACVAAHVDELVHERQDRIADDIGFLAHVIEIDPLDRRFTGDHFRRVGRNHADARFGLRQRHFDVDIALHERVVGKQRAHLRGAEGVAEQDGIDHGAGHRDVRIVMTTS